MSYVSQQKKTSAHPSSILHIQHIEGVLQERPIYYIEVKNKSPLLYLLRPDLYLPAHKPAPRGFHDPWGLPLLRVVGRTMITRHWGRAKLPSSASRGSQKRSTKGSLGNAVIPPSQIGLPYGTEPDRWGVHKQKQHLCFSLGLNTGLELAKFMPVLQRLRPFGHRGHLLKRQYTINTHRVTFVQNLQWWRFNYCTFCQCMTCLL